jgi:hypothetical protein
MRLSWHGAHSIANDEVFHSYFTVGRPRCSRTWFKEFSRFALEFRILLDSLQRHHRLFQTNEPANLRALCEELGARVREVLTMNSKSLVIVDANAKAKPAREALMLGVTRHARPAAPTMAEERRLNRMDNQRLTTQNVGKSAHA